VLLSVRERVRDYGGGAASAQPAQPAPRPPRGLTPCPMMRGGWSIDCT
jgi:hypothetical protein